VPCADALVGGGSGIKVTDNVRGGDTRAPQPAGRTCLTWPVLSGGQGRRLTSRVLVVVAALVATLSCTSCGQAASSQGTKSLGHHLGGTTCTTSRAETNQLPQVRRAMVNVTTQPFGVVTTADGKWSFVSSASGIDVLNDRSFPPRFDHQLSVPVAPVGEALTPDGRYLLAAGGQGAVVIDAAAAEADASDAVVGSLTGGGQGAIDVAVSPDSRFAFVTQEGSADLAVFNLANALAQGFGPRDFVGSVPLGIAPVGVAVSPDGRLLYATSEAQRGARSAGVGTLSVIDLAKAESDPQRSVVSTVTAGCSPVRVVVSRDGKTVWVTARGSNALLAFSASSLVSDPGHAEVAQVKVGEAPVGLALVNNDTRVVVADSNRFGAPGTSSDLSVADTDAALHGRPAVLGTIPAGSFPREMAVNGNTLLVTNYDAGQVEAIDTRTLP
jgi:DNA-binding beta-propeller fold protein YncE